jgi:integrase/recombinase XerD
MAENPVPVRTNVQLIDDWLEWLLHSRGRSERTIEAYALAMKRLREFMGNRPLLEAEPAELVVFCGPYLHKKGVLAGSRVPYISAVKGFYHWAKAARLVQELTHPKTGRPLPQMMSLANAEKLMWAPDMGTFIGIRDSAMLALMMGCGLRVSGLVGINESHLSNMQIGTQVRMALRVTEKGKKERLLPVPREAEMLLRVYLEHEDMADVDRDLPALHGRAPDRVLFVSVRSTLVGPDEHRGEKRRLTRKAVNDMIRRYGKRLDIPAQELHPHAMRHLFGTELTENDVPTVAVADLMGHADMKSTGIYTHLAARKKFANVDQHAPLAKMKTPVSELLKRLPPSA